MDSCIECGELLPPKATSCACGWKAPQAVKSMPSHSRLCAWVDHGIRCSKAGSLSTARGEHGQWYCAEHFFGKYTAKRRQTGLRAVAELQQVLLSKLG